MDAASRPPDPFGPRRAEIDASNVSPTPHESPLLLRAIFSGRARRFRSVGSLIYGIVGVLIFAIAVSAMVGMVVAWTVKSPRVRAMNPTVALSCLFLSFAAAYPTAIMTLQFFASCRLPVAVRLTLIYATLYSCLSAITYWIPEPIDGVTVIVWAPLCVGGFIQHRFHGWNANYWGQQAKFPSRLSIASLLDLTAGVAITMGIAAKSEIDPRGLLCLIPGCLIMSAVGMHAWGRLTALSEERKHRDLGLAIWMVGNAIAGCLVFLLIVMSTAGSGYSLLGFLVGPLVVLVAHVTTAMPIAWLRACGWRFVVAASESPRIN